MEDSEKIYSHFEDKEGNKYPLNLSDEEISFMFSNGKLIWYIERDFNFDIPLKLIPKE